MDDRKLDGRRRALLKLFPWLAATAAVPASAAPLAACIAAAPAKQAPEALLAPAFVKNWDGMAPGFDPNPIPIGTRCLLAVQLFTEENEADRVEYREVRIAAGPINPDPSITWKKPPCFYALDAPWIDEHHVPGQPWSPLVSTRGQLTVL